MLEVVERIREVFRREPLGEITTTDLVKILYSEEYERIKGSLHDQGASSSARVIAKRRKAQLHRRILHHLNRLVDNDELIVRSVHAKGEKVFALRASPRSTGHEMNLSAHRVPLSRLEHYHQKKILTLFDKENWYNRLNAVYFEFCEQNSFQEVLSFVMNTQSCVNDVIGIGGIEKALMESTVDELVEFLKKLDLETKDSNKYVNIIVNLTSLKDISHLKDLCSSIAMLKPSYVFLIVQVTQRLINTHQRVLAGLVKEFAENTVKINVQDIDIHRAPMLIGRAGVYTISDDEWDTYVKDLRDKTTGLCFSQVSVAIDVKRLLMHKSHARDFRDFMMKNARLLVESSTLQRRRADVAFAKINSANKVPHEFYRFSTNYIRLWNYDWQDDEDHLHLLYKSIRQELDEFCHSEEAIFKSCGIPIRFKISMSSAFMKFEPGFFTPRSYNKISVMKSQDLHEPVMKKYLETREQLAEIFSLCDRLRIFRSQTNNHKEVVDEWKHLFTHYKIPLICYDFAKRTQNITLDKFMS